MSLLTTELIHLSVTSVIAIFIYRKYHSLRLAGLCLAAGMLVDIDHLIDYLNFVNLSLFNLADFLSGAHYENSGRIYLLFHAYEYVVLLLALAYQFKKYRPVLMTIALAMLGHLLVDQFTNNAYLFAYSIIFRMTEDFGVRRIFY